MIPSLADRTTAVRLFDIRHGESERVLWFLSQQARDDLLAGEGGPIVETLVEVMGTGSGLCLEGKMLVDSPAPGRLLRLRLRRRPD